MSVAFIPHTKKPCLQLLFPFCTALSWTIEISYSSDASDENILCRRWNAKKDTTTAFAIVSCLSLSFMKLTFLTCVRPILHSYPLAHMQLWSVSVYLLDSIYVDDWFCWPGWPGLWPHTCLYPVSGGLTSKVRHDHREISCSWLTWILLPAPGLDLQPQTRDSSIYFTFLEKKFQEFLLVFLL